MAVSYSFQRYEIKYFLNEEKQAALFALIDCAQAGIREGDAVFPYRKRSVFAL